LPARLHDSGCAGAPTRSLRWRVAVGGGAAPRGAPACARARWSHSSCTHDGVARLLRAGFTNHEYCALQRAAAAWMAAPACLVHALCARRAVVMRASRAGACSVLASTAVLASVLYVSVYSDVVGPEIDGSGGASDMSGQSDAFDDGCGTVSEILRPFGSLQKVSDLDRLPLQRIACRDGLDTHSRGRRATSPRRPTRGLGETVEREREERAAECSRLYM
jgi:hypothetical protein